MGVGGGVDAFLVLVRVVLVEMMLILMVMMVGIVKLFFVRI